MSVKANLDRVSAEPAHTQPDPCTDQNGRPKFVRAQGHSEIVHTHSRLSSCYIVIYSITTIKTQEGTKQEGRRRKEGSGRNDSVTKMQEDFFTNILTSHFIARVWKGCSRFACERVLRQNINCNFLTPLLWPSRCVFLVLLMLGSTPSGFPRAPSVGCGFPYHIWSLAVWNSTGNCFGSSNSTELNNNSTSTRSPTGSLKSNV